MSFARLTTTTFVKHRVGKSILRVGNSNKRRLTTTAATKAQPKHPIWVPPAYRAARHEKARPFRKSSEKPSNDWPRKQRKQRGRIDVDRSHLIVLHNALLQLAEEYRSCFSPEESDLTSQTIDEITVTENWSNQKRILDTSVRYLKRALHDIHKSDAPIEWSKILETEDLFRAICRALQETILLSTYLCRNPENSSDLAEYVGLAEFELKSLLSVRSERGILVESVRTWSSLSKPVSISLSDQPARSFKTTLKGWVANLFDSFPTKGDGMDKGEGPEHLAHEDPSLGASQNLFRAVMDTIALTAEGKERKDVRKTAHRLVELLDLMPSNMALHSPDLAKLVLEMLCRAGALESARASLGIYQRLSKHDKVPFSLVMHAHVEAAKFEDDVNLLETVSWECYKALEWLWNVSFPRNRIERIHQVSLVLQCFTIAGMGTIPEMCDQAELLVKRLFGREIYEKLVSGNPATEEDRVDARTSMVLNYLIRLFASSGDAARVNQARQMLRYMTLMDGKDPERSMIPDVDACNLVLAGIWDSVQGGNKIEKGKAQEDLDFCFSLLNFMVERGGTRCIPDDETFLLIFRLLANANPSDIGDRAELLLSKMEMIKCFSNRSSLNITLSIYHRVLGCWLESAKAGTTTVASRRAMKLLEKLEIQSCPLLLNIREMSAASVPTLYNIALQPSRRTYKLFLNIFCAEAERSPNAADNARILLDVFERMVERDLIAEDHDAVKLLEKCLSYLPSDCEEKRSIQTYLDELSARQSVNTEASSVSAVS